MKVGLDTFTIRELNLDPFATLDWIYEQGLEGAQFGDLRSLSDALDPGRLSEVRSHADRLGLYTHISVPTCNPHLVTGSLEEHMAGLARQVETAARFGWHELHSALGGGPERYEHPVPWTQHLADSADLIRRLSPVLHAHGSRIDLETHGDVTTFELVRLIEAVGPDVCGICLDTANVLCHAEDPVLAARRAAPYTHLTHTKDGILFFSERGYTRQGRPPGEGCLDWERILPALGESAPDLPLSIEDHKWLFEFAVFEEDWHDLHPDLTCAELAKVIRLTWECERRIADGTLERPEVYEAIPFADQMLTRLHTGRNYLKGLLSRLGLAGDSG
ncbi:MAG: sugar phosphate isomerase/epimerase [Armatimonadetes bacterium]|nr:sugar phosphate isomerase/epimerase [Armatimonadota bacterium]